MAAQLQNQQVDGFVSDVATDLPKYGLDQPQMKVTFAAYASENTAESKAGEEPLDTILFGKVEGPNVYARLQDEPFIVSVPKSLLDVIHSDPLQWQDLAIYKLNPDDIAGLDVTKEGQATLSLVKEKGQWKSAKGDIALNAAQRAIAGQYAGHPARGGMGWSHETGTGPGQTGDVRDLHDQGQKVEHGKNRQPGGRLLECGGDGVGWDLYHRPAGPRCTRGRSPAWRQAQREPQRGRNGAGGDARRAACHACSSRAADHARGSKVRRR